jgi:asparagine synthase (glutamine-hydrolysing)
MTGLFGHVGAAPPGLLEHMAETLAHRGAAQASWTTPLVGLGQRWSSAERPHAQRIGESRDGQVRCAIGGSLFDLDALARELGLPAGLDDADVVAELLARAGSEGLARLDGAFVLAAWLGDRVLLARDALGERPLYYAHLPAQGLTLFACEIKALLATPQLPGVRVEPSLGSLAALLVFSFIPGPDTMFVGVQELEPGCFVELRPGHAPAPARRPSASIRSGPTRPARRRSSSCVATRSPAACPGTRATTAASPRSCRVASTRARSWRCWPRPGTRRSAGRSRSGTASPTSSATPRWSRITAASSTA